MIDRRSFLRASVGLVCAPAIVRASSLMPVKAYLPFLWADGLHDDTQALQARLDDAKPGDTLPSGRFLISRGLLLSNKRNVIWRDVSLIKLGGATDESVISGSNSYECIFHNMWIDYQDVVRG